MRQAGFSGELGSSLTLVEQVVQRSISGLRHGVLESAMNSVSSGGKMLRPALALSLYKLLGGNYQGTPNFLEAAAGIELIHRATLLPDDLLDKSLFRRGKPAVHVSYGAEVAMLAPYAVMPQALFLVTKCAREHRLGEVGLINVEGFLRDCARDLVVGELSDLRGRERSDAEVLECLALKNCLFRASCTLPAVFLGLEHAQVQSLLDFGTRLSVFHQGADDYGDLFATSDQLGGKPVRQDKDSLAIRYGRERTKISLGDRRRQILEDLSGIVNGADSDFGKVVREIVYPTYLD